MLRWTVGGYLAAFVVGPFAVSAAMGTSCIEWSQREVHQLETTMDDVLHEIAASAIVPVEALPAGTRAAALPGVILVHDDATITTIVHEGAHHVQMEQTGIARFAATYTVDWVLGMYHGCGPYDAYRQNRYEVQARQFAEREAVGLRRYLSGYMNGQTFAQSLGDLSTSGTLAPILETGDVRLLAAAVRTGDDVSIPMLELALAAGRAPRAFTTADRAEELATAMPSCAMSVGAGSADQAERAALTCPPA